MTVYAGWQLDARLGTGSLLGSFSGSSSYVLLDGIQQISLDYANKIDAKEATGQRTAYALVEGIIGVTGTIERFWTGSGFASGSFTNATTGSAIQERYLLISPAGFGVSSTPWVMAGQIKFDTQRSIQRPGSALLTETLGFIGLYVLTGSFA